MEKSNNIPKRALLSGDTILLLDNDFHPVKDISYLDKSLVDIIEVGSDYVKPSLDADHCDCLKYVKIRYAGRTGWVDGRKVFGLMKTYRNYSIMHRFKHVVFIYTKSV